MVVPRFYSFRLNDGPLSGLVRVDEPGPVLAYVDRERGGCVVKDDLLRHLVEGTTELEQVSEEQARGLAERYAVELDAEPLPPVYLDVDSDDSFLDLPEPRYPPDARQRGGGR